MPSRRRWDAPFGGADPGRDALSVFGMTLVMRDGKFLTNTGIRISFGNDFVDRIKQRFRH